MRTLPTSTRLVSSRFSQKSPNIARRVSFFAQTTTFLRLTAAIFVAAMLLVANSASAENLYWSVTSGDWSVASNWGGTEPTSSDDAYINNGGTALIASEGEECGMLSLGNDAGRYGSIIMTDGSLNVIERESIGMYGSGAFVQSGGTHFISDTLSLAANLGATATYSLRGGLLSVTNYERIEGSGSAFFDQTGGTHLCSAVLYLGGYYLSSGTYTLSGPSLLSTAKEYLGYMYGQGTFTQTGGTHLISGSLTLGLFPFFGKGVYTLAGDGVLTANEVNVTIGRFEWFGGTLTAQSLGVGGLGTLALGFDVDMNALCSGSLYHGSALGISSGTLEITRGATATQTGGTFLTSCLAIDSNSKYLLSGGTIVIQGGFSNKGILNCTEPSAIDVASASIVDISQGSIIHADSLSMNVPAGSLVIRSADFDPATAFASYSNAGMTHIAGTTLTVAADQGFGGKGDIDDLVVCSGTIHSEYLGFINLNKGLILFGHGDVNLGQGSLAVDDSVSCMTGGRLKQASQYVGKNASGSFYHSSGTNSVNTLYLGANAGSTGTYHLGGTGSISSNYQYIGYSGTGCFTQSGGSNLIYQTLYLGYNPGSSGTYLLLGGLCGGTFDPKLSEYIGYSGTGTFIQNQGDNLKTEKLFLGYNPSSSGSYTMSGQSRLTTNYEYIGYYGNGSFTQTGGTSITSQDFNLGYYSGSTGVYQLTNGLLQCNSNTMGEIIGYSGTGIFTQNGGTNSSKNCINLGFESGSSGSYTLDGPALLSTFFEGIGYGGVGTFSQRGGTNLISYALYLGIYSDSSGTYNLEGGTLITKSIKTGIGTAQFNFGGGTLQASDSFATELDMTLTGTGGDAKVDTAGHVVTLSGVLSGSGGLEKQGEGTLILSGINTYTGETTVGAGILEITGTHSSGGKITVADGAGIVFGTPYTPSPAPESVAGWSSNGTQESSREIASVPEPATILLLTASLLGTATILWRRK